MGTSAQRAVALGLLVVVGILSLPVAAALVDGADSEGLIVPVQLAVLALLGAVVGWWLPGIAGSGSAPARGAVVGALVGVAVGLVGVVLFLLLLGGP